MDSEELIEHVETLVNEYKECNLPHARHIAMHLLDAQDPREAIEAFWQVENGLGFGVLNVEAWLIATSRNPLFYGVLKRFLEIHPTECHPEVRKALAAYANAYDSVEIESRWITDHGR